MTSQLGTPLNKPPRINIIIVRRAVIILLGLAAIFAIAALTPNPGGCSWDFRNNLWEPDRLLVGGQPPFQINLSDNSFLAVWWPQIIGANFWMGWLPCWTAAKIWLMIELIGIGMAIWLLNDRKLPRPWELGAILLALFLFPPIYTHIHLGQFSLLFIVMMIFLTFVPTRGFPGGKFLWWQPLLIVLGAAKPQLCILIYPGILAATWKHQGFRAALRLVASAAGWLVVTLIPLFAFFPGWFNGFVTVTRYNLNVKWDLPTLFNQLSHSYGTAGIAVWSLIFIVMFGLVLWLWLFKPSRVAMIGSLALTPLVTLYASSWDFTLLLPAFIWLYLKIRKPAVRAGLFFGMLLVDAAQVYFRLGKQEIPDSSQWWIPPAMLTVICLTWLANKYLTQSGKPDQGAAVPG